MKNYSIRNQQKGEPKMAELERRKPKTPWLKAVRSIKRLLGYITPYWQLKVTIGLIILSTMLETISPSIIGGIIDLVSSVTSSGIIPRGEGLEAFIYDVFTPIAYTVSAAFRVDIAFALLGVLSIAIVLVASLIGALNYLQRYLLAYVSQKGSFEIRNDLYNSLLEQSFSFYDRERTGQLMARVTGDVDEIQRFFGFGLNQVVSSTLLFTLVFASMFSIDVKLTLVSLIFLPLILYTTFRFASKMGAIIAKVRNQFGVLTSGVQENLMGVRVVRGFAREQYEEEKFREECEKYFSINMEGTKKRAFYLPLATFISSLGVIFIIFYGGGQVINRALTIGSLIAFYFYVARLTGPVRMIGFITAMFQRATAAADRIFGVMDAKQDIEDREDALELESIEGRIVFRDVWFSYDGKNMVLKNVNLEAKPGDTIAILGATGSGKSSIINLIPRFYDATRGSITIDGIDIRNIRVKSLRRHIGIVRQDPFIFSKTIKENIAYGIENAQQEDIEAAAKKAQIHDFIASLPKGYDTMVGERGVTLSGGQKQRIAIARALLKNPKILILDDSTSSVDVETEYEIQSALEELFVNRTTFIITQRLSSIRKAGYIVVLDKGEIVEEGTQEELLAKRGIYYTLYQTQIAANLKEGDRGVR